MSITAARNRLRPSGPKTANREGSGLKNQK
jgi:hypothetical protein